MRRAGRGPVLATALAAAIAAQHGSGDVAARCRALGDAQDQGRLTVAAVLAALGDPDDRLVRTAAAIVRHEWVELPPELLDGLAGPAARRMLRELAEAPRPAARAFAARLAEPAPGRGLEERLLARAARGDPLVPAEALLLFDALRCDLEPEGLRALVGILPPATADAWLGRLHQGLAAGAFGVDRAEPLLARVSAAGLRQLLGLAVALPPDLAEPLCAVIVRRDPALVHDRVAAALDGEIALEAIWLRHAGPLLDRPARAARVRAALADPAVPELHELAFAALVDGGLVDDFLLDAADRDGAQQLGRQRRLLAAAIDLIPADRLSAWLDGGPELALATARALPRRAALDAALERRLVALLADAGVADRALGLAAATALVRTGSADAVAAIWPLLLQSTAWPELLDLFARRRAAFVGERLRAALAATGAGAPDAAQRLLLQTALARRGDRAATAALVEAAAAGQLSGREAHRCAAAARALSAAEIERLFELALAAADEDTGAGLLEWAVAGGGEALAGRLWQLWQQPGRGALRDVALRQLVRGPRRAALVAELDRLAAAGSLPEDLAGLPFELLSSMSPPLGGADLELCAAIVLAHPRGDPAGDAALALRWPDGEAGFPLVTAVAHRLRGASPAAAAAAFGAAAERALADPLRGRLSRQRLVVLWRVLAADRAVQRAVGIATAPLWAGLDGEPVGAGAAAYWLGLAAAGRGDFARAAAQARRAVAALLRDPEDRRTLRWLCGDRDPESGSDPWAALAAWPHWCEWRAALREGDDAAAAAAAARGRELAGHDAATLALFDDPMATETDR